MSHMPPGQCFLSNQDLSLSLKGPPNFGQISHLLLINYLALPSDTKAPKVRVPLYVCHHPNNHPPLSLKRATHRSTENSEYFIFAPSLSLLMSYMKAPNQPHRPLTTFFAPPSAEVGSGLIINQWRKSPTSRERLAR